MTVYLQCLASARRATARERNAPSVTVCRVTAHQKTANARKTFVPAPRKVNAVYIITVHVHAITSSCTVNNQRL